MLFKGTKILKLFFVILTLCLCLYFMLFKTQQNIVIEKRGELYDAWIRKDIHMIYQNLNITTTNNIINDMINCALPKFPDIPELDFTMEKAVVLYYDGSEKMFPFLISSVDFLQNESVVVLTFPKGLMKCMLLGVRCIDMSLTLTSKNSGCTNKRVIYSNANMCLPCYLYFFLRKGIEIIKFDLDIMCRKNISLWSNFRSADEFSSFCSSNVKYNIAAFRIKSSPTMITVLQHICEITFKAEGLFGIGDILPTLIGSSIKVSTCSMNIVSSNEMDKPMIKPQCVHVPNVDLKIKKNKFKNIGVWYGDKIIKKYFNKDQSKLAYYLRLNYKDKTYPLDVRNKAAFHTDSRYGGARGPSIGRYYLHKWLKKYGKKHINLNNTYDCLEIGDGHFIGLFFKNNCKSRQSLDLYDKRASIKGNIEFPEKRLMGKFDLIICAQVLEHVDYPHHALHGLNFLLKQNGTLFLTVPFISPVHGFPHDVTRFTSTGIRKLAKSTNFEIVVISTLGNSLTSIGYMLEMSVDDFWPYEVDHTDNTQYFGVYAVLRKNVLN